MSENRTPEEILALRLDLVLPPDRTSIPQQTTDPLVNSAISLSKLRTPELSETALAQIENKMLSAFDKQYRVQSHYRVRSWVAYGRKAAIAACLVFVFLIAGMIPASAGSLPGEPLYEIKRFVERIELAFAATPDAAASLRLEHAERRLDEALTLLERNQFESATVESALADLNLAQQNASPELVASLAFQWRQQRVRLLLQFVLTEVESSGAAEILPTDSVNPTASPQPGASATRTPTQLPTATHTSIVPLTATHFPADEAGPATECSGNSCSAAGVPGDQIDPENPPGQSGGRIATPPVPPGQGVPAGGQDNQPGLGNSGNGGGGGIPETPPGNSGANAPNSTAGNENGGNPPTAPPPQSNSGGNAAAPPAPGNADGNSTDNSGNANVPANPPTPNAGDNSRNAGNTGNGNGGGNGQGNGNGGE